MELDTSDMFVVIFCENINSDGDGWGTFTCRKSRTPPTVASKEIVQSPYSVPGHAERDHIESQVLSFKSILQGGGLAET